jgi:hypothetical protein
MKIWIDIKNSHEPLFFKSLMKNLKEHEFIITCRDYAEIVDLLNKYKMDYTIVGGRPQGNYLKRIFGFGIRVIKLTYFVPSFDFSLNHSSIWAVYTSTLRRKPNITISDNDIDHPLNRRMFKHVDYLFVPDSIPKKLLILENMKKEGIIQFKGFKEDIYLADYSPNSEFLNEFPFDDFITIRPEALQSTYIPKNTISIVPKLIKSLIQLDYNILFLPRYFSDLELIKRNKKIFIPKSPLNGLDVCYYSKAVLTGSGTFSRESALIGTPAVSFFPGIEILSVDKVLFKKNWILHSRNVSRIVEYLNNTSRRSFDKERAINTKNEVIKGIRKIIR